MNWFNSVADSRTSIMENITRDTYKVDAQGQTLGRLATDIAFHLMGKHKPSYQPNVDFGDRVEVENVANLNITNKKLEQKIYFHHSNYPGGLKKKLMKEVYAQNPAQVLVSAVSRMLPKNKLHKERMKRLKIS